MKNFVRLGLAVVAFLSSAAFSPRARATVTWTSTFEKGDLSEWTPGINGTKGTRKNIEVLTEQVYAGKYSCKVTVHPDDTFTFNQNRVDMQHPSTLTAEGKDLYLSGHYMMPEDAKTRNQIGFFETNVSFQNAMDIWVAPKTGGGTTINFAIGFVPDNAQWTADFKAGVWHQIAIHVHWSTMATVGYVDFWLDGVKTITMLKGKTKPNTDTLFYQTGLHRKTTQQVTDVIYLDDFIEADTEAEIKIAAAVVGGDGGVSDGSATGAGGATGAAGNGAGGTTGAAGTGATGAAGTGATGAAGTGVTGAAGTGTGAAGTGATGAAGTGTTGAAGSGATGAAGTTTPPPDDTPSGCGCATGGTRRADWLGGLALIALAIATRRRQR